MFNRLSLTEAQLRRSFFEKKLKEAKENLSAAEESLRGTGVSSGALKTSPGTAVEAVARLKAGVTVQEIKVASMRGYLADTSPEFVQAMKELSVLKAQLTNAEKSDTASGDGLYVSRYREFKYQETLYELFAKQYELARIDESREGAAVQVVDNAHPPEKKTKPKNYFYLTSKSNLDEAAKNLYSCLRKIKNEGYKSIAVEKIPNIGLGKAINDRLRRASKY